MAEVGRLAVWLALVAGGAAVLTRRRWLLTVAVAGAAFATLVLARALVGNDYSLVYVADFSRRGASAPYRLAALWGGMAGSLLWFATLAGAAGWWSARRTRSPSTQGVVAAVTGGLVAALAGLVLAFADPFRRLDVPAIDGGGLTPILEHPAMLYHPPLLYLGLATLTGPFALTVAGLLGRGGGDGWVAQVRRSLVVPWTLLAAGMLAGAHWAYVELGWGGYWAWDPVENTALLPWLATTLALHAGLRPRPTPPAAPATTAEASPALPATSGDRLASSPALARRVEGHRGEALASSAIVRRVVWLGRGHDHTAGVVGTTRRLVDALTSIVPVRWAGTVDLARGRPGWLRRSLQSAGAPGGGHDGGLGGSGRRLADPNAHWVASAGPHGGRGSSAVSAETAEAGDGSLADPNGDVGPQAVGGTGTDPGAGRGAGLGQGAMVCVAFLLALTGAMLTRSGAVSSVHAFAESRAIGRALGVLVVVAAVGVSVLLGRAVRAGAPGPGPAGGGLLGRLLAGHFTVVGTVLGVATIGTLAPLVTDLRGGDGIAIEGRYFASFAGPLAAAGLVLVALVPVAIRPAATRIGLSAAGAGAALGLGVLHRAGGDVDWRVAVLGGAAGAALVSAVAGGIRARRSGRGVAGHVAHAGIGLLLLGIAGTVSGTTVMVPIAPGERVEVRGETVEYRGIEVVGDVDNGGGRVEGASAVVADVHAAGHDLEPSLVAYPAISRVIAETSLVSTPWRDVQVALRDAADDGRAVVQIGVHPLQVLVWWGALVIVAGGIVSGSRRRPARRRPGAG